MSKPINITGEKDFREKVLESKIPVLVDFWAPWCMPCQMMAPVLEKIAKDFEKKLIVAKVNTEEVKTRYLLSNMRSEASPI